VPAGCQKRGKFGTLQHPKKAAKMAYFLGLFASFQPGARARVKLG